LLETVIGKEFDKVLVIYMVALFKTVVRANYFAKGAAVWWGKILGHSGT